MPAAKSRYWTVSPGDTLYSIAWAAGVDYRTLAYWNHIHRPFVIRAGTRLRLFGPRPPVYRRRKRVFQPERFAQPRRHPEALSASQAPVRWTWPAAGPIVRGFSPVGGCKGIDIGGRRGAPVRAAARGKVVYAGSGLRGYGELIILKHNKNFLSAYAHNNRILVKEGEMVRRGQEIAEMGSTGTDRVMLHFEIRLHGSPVDPLRYLPRTR
ncbi:MAG: peptidoglycan DD-metalloendopeptidase family protein [Acidiferrobacteraceae bacterium]